VSSTAGPATRQRADALATFRCRASVRGAPPKFPAGWQDSPAAVDAAAALPYASGVVSSTPEAALGLRATVRVARRSLALLRPVRWQLAALVLAALALIALSLAASLRVRGEW
jgi:hypothetical protein